MVSQSSFLSVSEQKHNILNDPDVVLMLEVQRGNSLAFEELVYNNQSRIQSVLFHLVGDRNLAEDLTQEVFLRVYKARENYQPEAKFSTWLYRIVQNVAFNAIRSRKRRPELLFGGSTSKQTSENESSSAFAVEDTLLAKSALMPTRQLDKQEVGDIVRKAIDELNPRQRLALLLNRFDGLSYQEIADTMNLTPKAVKSLLCRARLCLKKILDPYMEEGKGLS